MELILREERSVSKISLLKLEGSASNREQRSLHAHTRNCALVKTLDTLSLEDLLEHIKELHLELVSLLSLHTSLDHIHRSHQTSSEAASHHTSRQQTAQRNVAVLVHEPVLHRGVQREEDHRVGHITQQGDRRALVHTLDTQILAHYRVIPTRHHYPATSPYAAP